MTLSLLLGGAVWLRHSSTIKDIRSLRSQAEDHSDQGNPRSRVDHPLWSGVLDHDSKERRMVEFIHQISSPKRGDMRPIYEIFLVDIGVKRIVDYFETANTSCHAELHPLGAVIQKRVKNLETSFSLCQDACSYACIHGVLKTYFSEGPSAADAMHDHGNEKSSTPVIIDIEKKKEEVIDLCKEDSTLVRDFYRGNCSHAVGHAFAVAGARADTAIEYCSIFAEAAMEFYCQTGLFMELRGKITKELFDGASFPGARLSRAMDYCLGETRYPSACMRFILDPAEDLSEIKFIERKCQEQKGQDRLACFHALGYSGRHFVARQPEMINRICEGGTPTEQDVCISGLVLVRKNSASRQHVLRTLCEKVVDPSMKRTCEDQRNRHAYQIKNPIQNRMFTGP